MMKQYRGIVGCVEHCLGPLGISRTERPEPGDIGLVRAIVKRRDRPTSRLTGALCVPNGAWAVKSPRGLIIGKCTPAYAWAV